MEIRTKFNIGDEVYFINAEKQKQWYSSNEKAKIQKIVISIIPMLWDAECMFYVNGKVIWIPEGNCFATREEAQKECNRRNR